MQRLLSTIFLIGFSIISMGKPIFFDTRAYISAGEPTVHLNYTWDSIPDQTWLSYQFWCNSYLDWKVENHKVVAYPFFKNKRTAHISGIHAEMNKSYYGIEFDLGFFNSENTGYSGVLIGLGSKSNNAHSNLIIHNNRPQNEGLLYGCTKQGEFFLNEYQSDSTLFSKRLDEQATKWLHDSIGLKLKYEYAPNLNQVVLTLSRIDSILIKDTVTHSFNIEGNIALTYSNTQSYKAFSWFDNLSLYGKGLQKSNNETNLILSTFHNIQEDSLFLTAQLQPCKLATTDSIELYVISENEDTKEELIQFKYEYDSLAHQIRFRTSLKYMHQNMDYEVRYKGYQSQKTIRYKGKLKKIKEKNKLTLMTLNCNGYPFLHEGSYDYSNLWYPYEQITKGFEEFNPELLVFLGDQFYESRPNMPIYKAPFNYLDYLYKWNIYCLQFRGLTASTPTIILTDDHDVYHSNLWGNKGQRAQQIDTNIIPTYYQENYDTWQQDNGGYLMSDTFVNMAIRSQTSHLPQPYYRDSSNVPNYYTSYQFGKFDFAILEDKKFKSPPSSLNIPIYNGQPLNDSLTPKELNNDSLQLLGNKQLEFLTDFYQQNPNTMKIVLTQSAYAGLTTVDSASHPLKDRPAEKSNQHKLNRDMDTNGWPKTGRDKAMAIIGPQASLVLAGDQHLGSLVELYDTLGNGTYFFTTPSIANTWPRTWYPSNSDIKKNTLGEYEDGFGNKMKVRAVANPLNEVLAPIEINSKSPGFGIIELNKFWKTAKIHAYPLNFTELKKHQEYQDWPIKVKVK